MSLISRFLISTIRAYRAAMSPLLGCNCRYVPSCSHYAEEAVACFGMLRGMYLATKRILRCHPFASHGFDPVPK